MLRAWLQLDGNLLKVAVDPIIKHDRCYGRQNWWGWHQKLPSSDDPIAAFTAIELALTVFRPTLFSVVSLLPRLKLLRFVCAALLAAISLQASEPFQSLELGRGSAFSVATSDVAVAPSRLEVAASESPEPATPAPIDLFELAEVAPSVSLPLARPQSTGPPAGSVVLEPYAPRGPPLA